MAKPETSKIEKRPRPKRRLQYVIAVFGTIVTVVTMIITVWLKLQDSQLAKYEAERDFQITKHQMKMLEDLETQNDSLYAQLIQVQEIYRGLNIDSSNLISDNSIQLLNVSDRIETLENGFLELESSHQRLKRSLKPTEIEDLLTIPRLQDEVKIIKDKLDDLELELSRRQTSFETSIRAEAKSSNQSTNLILVVLIPLIINFLYTVWKDLKENKKPETE